MNKFPRALQNELLMRLYDAFPDYLSDDDQNDLTDRFGGNDIFIANMEYLAGHNLITCKRFDTLSDININFIKITHKGIDFISDDGGLGAILNVSTVRIHDDTIEKLILLINNSSLSPDAKASYLSKLKELPLDATRHLMTKLVDLGLDKVADSYELIEKFFQGLGS